MDLKDIASADFNEHDASAVKEEEALAVLDEKKVWSYLDVLYSKGEGEELGFCVGFIDSIKLGSTGVPRYYRRFFRERGINSFEPFWILFFFLTLWDTWFKVLYRICSTNRIRLLKGLIGVTKQIKNSPIYACCDVPVFLFLRKRHICVVYGFDRVRKSTLGLLING